MEAGGVGENAHLALSQWWLPKTTKLFFSLMKMARKMFSS